MKQIEQYLTWLDFYTLGAFDKLKKEQPQSVKKLGITDDVGATWVMVNLIMRQAGLHKKLSNGDHMSRTQLGFAMLSMPFFDPDKTLAKRAKYDTEKKATPLYFTTPIGLSVSARLAEIFANAKPPETDAWREELKGATVYVDLPAHVTSIGQGQALRALLAGYMAESDIMIVAIITDVYGYALADRMTWKAGHNDYTDARQQLLCEQSENILRNCLLYRISTRDQPQVHLPRATGKGKAHKRRNELRKKTLFKIQSLSTSGVQSAHEDAPLRDREDEEISWTLGHRVDVRGHFRWQPHGKKRSEHKLIWITEHVRGPDIEKPALIPIRGKNRGE